MKSLKNLFLAGLAVLAIVSAACKNDPDPYTPPIDAFLNDFEDLDQASVTGQATISVTDASLGGDDIGNVAIFSLPSSIPEGYNLAVSGGKLTLNLTAPNPTKLENESNDTGNFNRFKESIFGTKEAPPEGTFNPDTAKFRIITSFHGKGKDEKNYNVERYADQTDEETYFVGSMIYYIYVDTDCKIKKAAQDFQKTEDGESWTESYGAIDLSLKPGWNLVQINQSWDGPEATTITVKLADKNLPWVIRLGK